MITNQKYQCLKKHIQDEYNQACMTCASYHTGKTLESILKTYESIYLEKLKQLDSFEPNYSNESNIVSK